MFMFSLSVCANAGLNATTSVHAFPLGLSWWPLVVLALVHVYAIIPLPMCVYQIGIKGHTITIVGSMLFALQTDRRLGLRTVERKTEEEAKKTFSIKIKIDHLSAAI